jgi:hypothetical protein
MQEPSERVQTLAVAYHVERMQGGQGLGEYLSYTMLLIHRMEPTPRGSSYGGHCKLC